MMISTKGRYALRVMIDLTEHNDGSYIPLRDIANRQNVSEKYLESIVPPLTKAGFLDGLRGKGGGYRLTMQPEEYSVGSIIRSAEGSLAPVSCLSDPGAECPRADSCKSLPIWRELDRRINEYLDGVTLAEAAAGAVGAPACEE